VDNFKRTDPKLVEGPCALKAQGPEGDSKIGTLRRSQQRREGIKQSGGWPRLTRLRLTQQQQTARADGVGGSDANIILSGDTDRIRDLWLEKRGEASPPDLSDKLPVMLGCWTEPFNRQWFEQLTNEKITGVGKSFRCTRYNWRRCTLDGIIQSTGTIWEAKHTSAFAKPEEVLERYMPQLQHNMAVTGHQQAVLSVIFGNHKFEVFEVAADWLYQMELLDAEQHFWECVQTGREPAAPEPPPAPRPSGTREICLDGNNAWASAAFDWLRHREAAKVHASACSSIKSLVEADVARAFGHGVEARRSKSGAITIRELA
jgi:predicted phage-related endonuclease